MLATKFEFQSGKALAMQRNGMAAPARPTTTACQQKREETSFRLVAKMKTGEENTPNPNDMELLMLARIDDGRGVRISYFEFVRTRGGKKSFLNNFSFQYEIYLYYCGTFLIRVFPRFFCASPRCSVNFPYTCMHACDGGGDGNGNGGTNSRNKMNTAYVK